MTWGLSPLHPPRRTARNEGRIGLGYWQTPATQVPAGTASGLQGLAGLSGTGASVSAQVCAPVLQLVAPTWQASAGTQASPAWQATQAPPLQTPGAPPAAVQLTDPASTGVPPPQVGEGPQVSAPVPATTQTLAGVQAPPPTQDRQAPVGSQTLPPPQGVPVARSVPRSRQAGTPKVQVVAPAWQALAGVQATPVVQATQAPAASQTFPPPHGVPGAAKVLVSVQVGAPVAQLEAPTWQALAGVQARPAWQGMQRPFAPQMPGAPPAALQVLEPGSTGVPPPQVGVGVQVSVPLPAARQVLAGEQTPPAAQAVQAPVASQTLSPPQGVPVARSAPVSVQVCAPVVQLVTPAWQALAGVQARPSRQATQAPDPLQTPGCPEALQESVPAGTGVPPPQVSAGVQVSVPVPGVRQVLAGEQAAPSAQATQAPSASQTVPVPQLVPAAIGVPVSVQVVPPVLQLVTPAWQALAGVQARPAWHGEQKPVPSQTPGRPEALQESEPAGTGVPPPQAGAPAQESVPVPGVRQVLAGVQLAPLVQATQAPTASQVLDGPQAVPGATRAPVSAQVWAPVLQLVAPTWQALAGVQVRFAWQAAQAPVPLQTPGSPAALQVSAPAGTGKPPAQAGPVVQVTVPLAGSRQTLAGVQLVPAAQGTQAPAASQTCPAPQAVPALALTRVSTQVSPPVLQEVRPTSHGLAGTQTTPARQARQAPAPLQTPA